MSVIEQPALQECPFCGGKALLHNNEPIEMLELGIALPENHILHYAVTCGNPVCAVTTDWHMEYIEAIKHWNRRI